MVEVAEVVHDLFGGVRRPEPQHAAVFDCLAVGRRIAMSNLQTDHPMKQGHLVRGELLDQTEVEKGHPHTEWTPFREEIITWMRVAVEDEIAVQTAKHEPVDYLSGKVAFSLRPSRSFGKSDPWRPG